MFYWTVYLLGLAELRVACAGGIGGNSYALRECFAFFTFVTLSVWKMGNLGTLLVATSFIDDFLMNFGLTFSEASPPRDFLKLLLFSNFSFGGLTAL